MASESGAASHSPMSVARSVATAATLSAGSDSPIRYRSPGVAAAVAMEASAFTPPGSIPRSTLVKLEQLGVNGQQPAVYSSCDQRRMQELSCAGLSVRGEESPQSVYRNQAVGRDQIRIDDSTSDTRNSHGLDLLSSAALLLDQQERHDRAQEQAMKKREEDMLQQQLLREEQIRQHQQLELQRQQERLYMPAEPATTSSAPVDARVLSQVLTSAGTNGISLDQLEACVKILKQQEQKKQEVQSFLDKGIDVATMIKVGIVTLDELSALGLTIGNPAPRKPRTLDLSSHSIIMGNNQASLSTPSQHSISHLTPATPLTIQTQSPTTYMHDRTMNLNATLSPTTSHSSVTPAQNLPHTPSSERLVLPRGGGIGQPQMKSEHSVLKNTPSVNSLCTNSTMSLSPTAPGTGFGVHYDGGHPHGSSGYVSLQGRDSMECVEEEADIDAKVDEHFMQALGIEKWNVLKSKQKRHRTHRKLQRPQSFHSHGKTSGPQRPTFLSTKLQPFSGRSTHLSAPTLYNDGASKTGPACINYKTTTPSAGGKMGASTPPTSALAIHSLGSEQPTPGGSTPGGVLAERRNSTSRSTLDIPHMAYVPYIVPKRHGKIRGVQRGFCSGLRKSGSPPSAGPSRSLKTSPSPSNGIEDIPEGECTTLQSGGVLHSVSAEQMAISEQLLMERHECEQELRKLVELRSSIHGMDTTPVEQMNAAQRLIVAQQEAQEKNLRKVVDQQRQLELQISRQQQAAIRHASSTDDLVDVANDAVYSFDHHMSN